MDHDNCPNSSGSNEPVFRSRKLFAPDARMSPDAAKKLAAAPPVDAFLSLVRRAGQEALRCGGRGWLPDSDIAVAVAPSKPLGLKLIGFRRIELTIDPKAFALRSVPLHAQGIANNPIQIMENAAGALVRLFAGYYDICPWDAWRHRSLVQAAVWGAYGTQWVSRDEEDRAARVAVFFERSIVSQTLTEVEGGVFVEGLACERVINGARPDLLTALLDRCQAILFPKVWQGMSPALAVPPDPVAEALLPEAMALLFNARVRMARGVLVLRGRAGRPRSWEWRRRVEALAELLVPYLERQERDDNPNPRPNPPGIPAPGEIPGPPGIARPVIDDGPHPFDRQPGFNPGGPLPGHTPGPNTPLSFEALDQYYSERAETLVVRDKAEQGPKRRPEQIALGGLGYEEASIMDLLYEPIDFSRTRPVEVDDDHPLGLRFFKSTEPILIPAKGDIQVAEGLPHLMLVCDSSGSMRFNPRGSGNARGKYDTVLMAAWGMFKHIENCEERDRVQVHALNFASRTIASGWKPIRHLESVKRTLAQYQGGGTTLDIAKLREAFNDRPGEFLAIIITDGQLGNTAQALEAFGELARAGNHLVLLHVGTKNSFTDGIQKLDGTVHLLTNADDLLGLCLDIAKERYNTRAHGETQLTP